MKSGKDHIVPLSDHVLAILNEMPRSGELIFEGGRHGKPIGVMGMNVILQRTGCGGTVHGFFVLLSALADTPAVRSALQQANDALRAALHG
jgi:hypothetical protein